ncbi:uncharacterized protein PITG_10547 [Phytophthora infestans T30-4]|uniref:Uncharacterized protein n=1 Tax=Phytophthora infestans (strain T30-4) TaxID=403677 RepID=D0NFK7_PHYIT|nr:uncharacterized protein PITG_10547 [Phytophthora infestans T30-4]EEY56996.1 hypothetical protein PITG_10547 [Phytophthora infestans T30-4]|eukprot:XP_002902324.1 hypothetical protein PITG_10547 [Phytophthora infestans T30-4]
MSGTSRARPSGRKRTCSKKQAAQESSRKKAQLDRIREILSSDSDNDDGDAQPLVYNRNNHYFTNFNGASNYTRVINV